MVTEIGLNCGNSVFGERPVVSTERRLLVDADEVVAYEATYDINIIKSLYNVAQQ